MVKSYVGDYGKDRLDYVGAVQSAAQSGLNHGHVDLLVGKPAESHGGSHLKERRMQRLQKALVVLNEPDYIVGADRLSVYPDALAEIGQMGRCVKAGL